MKADIGSLLFIKDKIDESKKRPFVCVHIFSNNAGVPYNWLILPITSKDSVGKDNLVEISHAKLGSTKSYAKLNNMTSIPWDDEIEVSKRKFAKKHIRSVQDRLSEIFKEEEKKKN